MSTTNLMPDDRRSLTIRLSVLQYLVAVIFAALAVGFWVFQIAQHQKFLETAENNRTRKLPLPAPRGVLLDRDGKVLVENQNTLQHRAGPRADQEHPEVLRMLAAATVSTKPSCARRSTAAAAIRSTGPSCSSRTRVLSR